MAATHSNVIPLTPSKALTHRDLGEFLKHPYPEREHALAPWLPFPGLAMVAGYRGCGKTYFGLAIAYAIASGGEVLGWQAGKPRKVLYVDGEMNPADVQDRLAAIHNAAVRDGNGDVEAAIANLSMVCDGDQATGIPDLAGAEGKRCIEAKIKETGAEVLILDNKSALFRNMGASANEEESWIDAQEWLLKLRRDRKTVVLVHHTGKPDKSGQVKQRGTSKTEDVLDTSILLQVPSKTEKKAGVNFNVEFTKNRGFVPPNDPVPVQIRHEGGECRLGQPHLGALIVTMYREEGKTQEAIAEELGVHQSTVSRYLKKLPEAG